MQKESQDTPGVTGKFGLGLQNEAGQRLIEFCQENALVIANTLFQQHKRRFYTWASPQGETEISHSVMPNSLWPHGLQHTRLPVQHQLPEFTQNNVHWVGDAIQPSHPLSSPSPPTFNLSQHQDLFQWVNSAWGGQSIGVSALASVPPMNTQNWSPLEWTGWISLQSKGLSRVLSNTTVQKHQFFSTQLFFTAQHSHPYMTTGKTIALTRWTFVGKVISLLLNMLSRLVITFLPRSKRLLISWLQSPSAVILEPQKIVWQCFHCFPIYSPWSDGTKCHDLHFLNVEF